MSSTKVIENAINEIRGKTSFTVYNNYFLSWEEILMMDKDGLVTIGAHTHEHLPLRNLEYDESKHQILESKRLLEYQLGHPVYHFAYPFGTKKEVSTRDLNLVRESGFKTAVTTENTSLKCDTNNYFIPRQSVLYSDTLDSIIVKLSGWNALMGIN